MPSPCVRKRFIRGFLCMLTVGSALAAVGQTCLTREDMDASTVDALEAAGRKYVAMAEQGATSAMQSDAIPTVASDFAGIANAVKDSQSDLAGSPFTLRPPYLLKAEGTAPLARAEFLCGVFGKTGQTPNSAVFVIPNLQPGDYAIVIGDVAGKTPLTVSLVLQKVGADWKLGGFYAKPAKVAGHDAQWFWDQAREFKAKGKNRDAWLYYVQARDLFSALPFMSTMATDQIYDESHEIQPTDLPLGENSVELIANGKTYKLNAIFPVGVGDDLDLVVKYASASVANTAQTYEENVALIKALLAKYPEFRDGFQAIIARATEPSGKDYGTLLAVQEVH
jgi:hypothetical protein